MPIDGTYGRLSGHQNRMNELKHKKKELQRNVRSPMGYVRNAKYEFNKVDKETLEKIKSEIREKASRKRLLNNLTTFILVTVCIGFTIWLTLDRQ